MSSPRSYRKGLEDLGGGHFAYLQPDGSWGYSNAGLICDGRRSLLVDTLFDLPLTEAMLRCMRDATPAASQIDVVVNTHANGDHTYGNQLVRDATIIASERCASEVLELPPAQMAALIEAGPALGPAGAYLARIFGPFQFAGIELTPPTQTFSGRLDLEVGGKRVTLIEVGPAHTRGDVIVHVPADGVVYTGDILFIDGTPIMWEGPVQNWIDACDLIVSMEPRVVVPGHGPLTDVAGVRRMQAYLYYIRDEARRRFDAGMPPDEACRDIALADFSSWTDPERIVINVHTLYREFSGRDHGANIMTLFALMAEIAA